MDIDGLHPKTEYTVKHPLQSKNRPTKADPAAK